MWAADRNAADAPAAALDAGLVADTAAIAWRWALRRGIPAGTLYLRARVRGGAAERRRRRGCLHPRAARRTGRQHRAGPTSPLLVDTVRLRPLAIPSSGVRIVRASGPRPGRRGSPRPLVPAREAPAGRVDRCRPSVGRIGILPLTRRISHRPITKENNMRHEWTTATVDGFGSGELDFEARLAAADQAVRDQVDDLIMSPLVNGVDGAVLLIRGHADRVDTGQDHATCLQLESDASRARARSAGETILMMIGRDWISRRRPVGVRCPRSAFRRARMARPRWWTSQAPKRVASATGACSSPCVDSSPTHRSASRRGRFRARD